MKQSKKDSYLSELIALVKARGGYFLSTAYSNMQEKYKVKCGNGHIFECRGYNLKNGKWCPTCRVSIKEKICRLYFEKIFESDFPKGRPCWLLSKNKTQLELDGFNEKLGIAFEYQGEQHFNTVSLYKQDANTLKQLQDRDETKLQRCRENGVTLFIINPVYKYKEILPQIKLQAELFKINIQIENIEIDFDSAFNLDNKLDELRKYAEIRNGKLLSPAYLGAHEKHKFECENRHTWETSASCILNKETWCPVIPCFGRKDGPSIARLIQLAEDHGGQLLTLKYENNSSPMQWKCKEGHTWWADTRSVWCHNHWCLTCKYTATKLKTDNYYQDLATNLGIKFVAIERIKKANYTELRFKAICASGHQINLVTNDLNKRLNSNKVLCKECVE